MTIRRKPLPPVRVRRRREQRRQGQRRAVPGLRARRRGRRQVGQVPGRRLQQAHRLHRAVRRHREPPLARAVAQRPVEARRAALQLRRRQRARRAARQRQRNRRPRRGARVVGARHGDPHRPRPRVAQPQQAPLPPVACRVEEGREQAPVGLGRERPGQRRHEPVGHARVGRRRHVRPGQQQPPTAPGRRPGPRRKALGGAAALQLRGAEVRRAAGRQPQRRVRRRHPAAVDGRDRDGAAPPAPVQHPHEAVPRLGVRREQRHRGLRRRAVEDGPLRLGARHPHRRRARRRRQRHRQPLLALVRRRVPRRAHLQPGPRLPGRHRHSVRAQAQVVGAVLGGVRRGRGQQVQAPRGRRPQLDAEAQRRALDRRRRVADADLRRRAAATAATATAAAAAVRAAAIAAAGAHRHRGRRWVAHRVFPRLRADGDLDLAGAAAAGRQAAGRRHAAAGRRLRGAAGPGEQVVVRGRGRARRLRPAAVPELPEPVVALDHRRQQVRVRRVADADADGQLDARGRGRARPSP